jgi:ABC-type nitrate/sulfonate/bicarbonate transport system substrate-binding protein
MRWHLRSLVLALGAMGLLVAGACGDDTDANGGTPAGGETARATATARPERVTFMAGFRPQANLPFVAAYVAQEKGFFAEEGLEVDIRHSGGGDEHIQLLLGGRVDFTTHLASGVLQQRTQEPKLPIMAFVLWGQSSPAGFVTLKESGIDSIQKFEGKRYGFKQKVSHEYLATLDAAGVDRSKIQEVSVGFDPSIILSGQVNILAVFLNNEPWVIEHRLGKAVNVFDPADFGVETLGLTYIATEDTITKRPEVVERFTRATLRGAQWAIEHEEEAIGIVLKRMDAGEDQREHQTFLFREDVRQARSAVTESKGIGAMTLEQWQKNADILLKYRVTETTPDAASAFTSRFVDAFYRR